MEQGMSYDVAVLGAGVEGSATAYYLKSKAGVKRVLLLEQFSRLHTRGSSQGSSRVTRQGYHKDIYVKMTKEAFVMMSNLERESGTRLFEKSGVVILGPEERESVKMAAQNFSINEIPYEKLTGSEVSKRYSKQLNLPADTVCLHEAGGGLLMANRVVDAFQKLFVSTGGEFLDEHSVTEIIPGQVITLRTTKGTFRTKKLVITAGPWTPGVLRPLGLKLPLTVLHTGTFYWKAENPENFSKDNFPVILAYLANETNFFYMVPIHEYPGLVKIGTHYGEETSLESHDASRPFAGIEITANAIRKYVKGVATTPSVVEPCLYTETPDLDFFLDRHPAHSNIIIGAGFSGHGFKLSPVIGKILSELALELPPSYDLSTFKISRFDNRLKGNL